MPGLTVTEKILARCAGRDSVRSGEQIYAKPDFVHAYELKGTTDVIKRNMAEMGAARVPGAKRFAIYIDHRVPSKTPDQEAFHEETRAWARDQQMTLFDRKGIGHQVASEEGYAVPGSFSVHADPHISQLGAFGALALGIRGNIIEAFVDEGVTLTVPHSTKVWITGTPAKAVMGRDIFHHLLYKHGPAFASFQVLEFSGPGASTITVESRQTICGLAMFTGALTAVFDPTDDVIERMRGTNRIEISPARADKDATYQNTIDLDLADVEPMIVLPPTPANARPLQEHLGIPVQAGYLGSCASGRVEDLQIAAKILAGRKIDQSFSLHIVPSSQKIMLEAARNGSLAALVDAGAFVSSSSCDFCSGNIATMTSGQRAVSTGTLNVPGRMGAIDADIYLASAATVAASALRGVTADPREFLK